jgi:soluble cytochrome b562
MSVHTTPMPDAEPTAEPAVEPAVEPAAEAAGAGRRRAFGWITGGATLAAAIAAATIALWPASEADKARDNGESFGAAVAQLEAATTQAEAEAALTEVRAAAADTREDVDAAVSDQVAAQADALERAVDGFVGATTTTDEWEAELYEWELDVAVNDLADNAEDFRTTGPEVQQAFWQGFETGHAG